MTPSPPAMFPQGPEELYHDAIRDVRFQVARLEAQRPDMAQRAKAFDATTYAKAGDAGGGSWSGASPSALSLSIDVPTDNSFVVFCWGEEVVQVDTAVGTAGGSNTYISYILTTLSLDGSSLDTHTGNALLYDTINWAKSSLNYGTSAQPARARKVAAGTHTFTWSGSTTGLTHTTSTLYLRNRWIQAFVQA